MRVLKCDGGKHAHGKKNKEERNEAGTDHGTTALYRHETLEVLPVLEQADDSSQCLMFKIFLNIHKKNRYALLGLRIHLCQDKLMLLKAIINVIFFKH